MLDKGIETGVLRDDVEICSRILRREFSYVVGDVEVEGVLAVAGDSDVLGARASALQRRGNIDRNLGLTGSDENNDLEVILLQSG